MKKFEITYMHNSCKQVVMIEATDETEAGKKFKVIAPDVDVDNVLSVIDLDSGKFNRNFLNIQLVVSLLFLIIGLAFFLERGYFAAALFDAHTLGNNGWLDIDAQKIQTIAKIGIIMAILGLLATLFNLFKRFNK